MRTATEIYNDLQNAEKEKKYQRMIGAQEKIIVDAIKSGDIHGSRLFIFSDKECFNGYETEWYEEFLERATRELESKGYKTKGIVVYW